MKKLLILLTSLFFAVTVNAQFKLTIDGFVSLVDETKDYSVCSFDNSNKEVLFLLKML